MLISSRPTNRAFVVVAVFVFVLFVGLFTSVQGADAAKLTACVNKRTGAMKLVTGKQAKRKCRAGSYKITWNRQGRRGPAGKPPQVVDAKGRLVGRLLGVLPAGIPAYIVQRNGGQYIYFGSGDLYGLGSPAFTTSNCSGTAYLKGGFGPGTMQKQLRLAGGPFRLVFRTSTLTGFGPALVWKSAGTFVSVVATQTYTRDSSTGVCQADVALYSGKMIALKRVKTPPDFIGPLVVK